MISAPEGRQTTGPTQPESAEHASQCTIELVACQSGCVVLLAHSRCAIMPVSRWACLQMPLHHRVEWAEKMNCPHCGTYNPQERTTCWRCDQELPKPALEKKKKDPRKLLNRWIYVAIMVFVILNVLQMCGFGSPSDTDASQEQAPSGCLPRRAPIVYRTKMPWGI